MTPDELDTFRDGVSRALREFVDARRADLAELGSPLAGFLDAALDFVDGGKRLRPIFCLAGWRVAGGDPDDPRAVTAAAALEWLQASALVHDDLMDGSDTRRGRPSVHRAFEARHREQGLLGDGPAFGRSAAVLLGDLMLSWTDEQLRASGLPRVHDALPYLDLCRTEVVAGQYLDVLSQTRHGIDADEAMQVVRYKSAKYTVERPLHLGAALAGGDTALLARLSDVALPLGEAFQLRDDVLGVYGDPAVTGKPAGDDLREGKRTLLIARAAERGDAADRDRIERLIGTAEGVPVLSELIVRTGALAAVEADITALEERAEQAVARLDPAAGEVLRPLAALLTRRSR